jgi:hypothetical protein
MNGENYQYLTEEVLPRLGFPQALDDQLLTKMKKGGDTITLEAIGNFGKDGKDRMEYAFHLEYNKETDRYYLNAIRATLTKENEQPLTHNFSLFAQKGYNADEMYNMLDGRFVYREFNNRVTGDNLSRWSKVDPVRKDEDGNSILRSLYDNNTKFNLVVALGELPLTYMSQTDKEKLIRDMQQGDPNSLVTIRKPDGSRQTVTLLARPDVGAIYMYDKEGKRLMLEEKRIQGVDKKFTVKDENTEVPSITAKLMEKAEGNGVQPTGTRKKV